MLTDFFLLWNLKSVYSLSSVSCTQRMLNNCLVCEKPEQCLLNTEYLIRLCNKLKRVYRFCMFIYTFKFLDNHQTCSWYSIAPININESPKWNSSLLDIFVFEQIHTILNLDRIFLGITDQAGLLVGNSRKSSFPVTSISVLQCKHESNL